jgi:hypothetical protein
MATARFHRLLIAYQPWDTYNLVLTYVFFCVEIPDGISGSESNDSIANNPTAAQSVGFQNDSTSQEIFELQRLEDMGLCEPIDDT